jgi:phosphonate transport system substrate-binding protein
MTNSLSIRRIAAVVVPIIIVALVWTYWWSTRVEADARSAMESDMLADMLGRVSQDGAPATRLSDKDGDLIADAPTDPTQLQDPETSVFSYIAEGDESEIEQDSRRGQRVWNELLEAIAKQTNRKIAYRHFSGSDEQLTAFGNGEVHVLGLNTGAVDVAVEHFGFVPICALGNADGTYGYTMKIIAPSSKVVRNAAELRGRKVTFVRPNSNSGFKAAFVYLMDAHGLLPERDYQWSFSLDHEKSIRDVVEQKTDAAAIASDVLARLVNTGEVDKAAIATIYESESFPPATIGFAYNLKPELQDAIQQSMLGFDWSDTELQSEFGPMGAEKFVAVNYKDDWANIRRIERSIDKARSGL